MIISIIAIIGTIVVPSFQKYTRKAKKEVCKINCTQIERMYNIYLHMNSMEHNDTIFANYIDENWKIICPEHGVINYLDGMVKCTIHNGRDDGNEIPFL